MKNRNGYIDLLRFLASLVILYLHFGIAPFYRVDGTIGSLPGGALFVEFFFMLSGYFCVNTFFRAQNKEEFNIARYTVKKYLHFLPYSVLASCITYFWTLYAVQESAQFKIKYFFSLPFDALLLYCTGINLTSHMVGLWYLSAMLITIPVLLYLLKHYTSAFRGYLVWILPLFLYGFLIRKFDTVRTSDWIYADMRALAGLTLGGGIFYVSKFLEQYQISNVVKTVLTAVELLTMGAAFYYCTYISLSRTQYDIVFLILVYVSLCLTFSGKTWTSRIHGKIFSFLGKISLSIYCIQQLTIYRIVKEYYSYLSVEKQLALITVITIFAACLLEAAVKYLVLPLSEAAARKWKSLKSGQLGD